MHSIDRVTCKKHWFLRFYLFHCFSMQTWITNPGEPVPAHYALAYIMRLDSTCCVCYCSDALPRQPVPVVVPYGTAHDQACQIKCTDASACGKAGGHFADAFSSACM